MQITARVTNDIEHHGSGKFASFAAMPGGRTVGEADGYDTLNAAVCAMTDLTVGTKQTAVGIYELDGRFVGRELTTNVRFAGGATWSGPWRLEQYPDDRAMFDGSIADGVTTRGTSTIRAVVDGAQALYLDELPVKA